MINSKPFHAPAHNPPHHPAHNPHTRHDLGNGHPARFFAHPGPPRTTAREPRAPVATGNARPDESAVRVAVVATVTQHIRAAPGPAALAPHGGHRLQQRDELRDVVAVVTGQGAGERDSGGIGDQMAFTAASTPVDRASSGLGSLLTPGCGSRRPAREKSRVRFRATQLGQEDCAAATTPQPPVHSAGRRQPVVPELKPAPAAAHQHAIRRDLRPAGRGPVVPAAVVEGLFLGHC